jgi:hypothetical protein
MSVTLCGESEFHENRFSESHALRRSVNELLSDLGQIWYKISAHNAVEHL